MFSADWFGPLPSRIDLGGVSLDPSLIVYIIKMPLQKPLFNVGVDFEKTGGRLVA